LLFFTRATILLENIHDSKQRENWIACTRKLGKRKRWELICDETRYIPCFAHAFRFPIDARRVPGAMECQLKRDKTNRRARELSMEPSDAGGLCTRLDRGLVWRVVGDYQRQNFILALRVISTFYRLPSTVSYRARNRDKKTLEMTNELGEVLCRTLIHRRR